VNATPAPLVDIGVNLSHNQFRKDLPSVMLDAARAGVGDCILTGTSEQVSEEVLQLCRTHSGKSPCRLFCTAGIHPHDARQFTSESLDHLATLAKNAEVVAIGETGLDFNRDYSPRPDQEKVFQAQLQLGAELQLPLFMHERDAHERQLAIIKDFRDFISDGVIHCFTGNRKALFNYLDLGLYIGITGWICDERRGLELRQLVASIPLDRLLLETDAPYLLPGNLPVKPKNRRNEPAFLPRVLEMVALHRPEQAVDIAQATTASAYRFFRLPPLSGIGMEYNSDSESHLTR